MDKETFNLVPIEDQFKEFLESLESANNNYIQISDLIEQKFTELWEDSDQSKRTLLFPLMNLINGRLANTGVTVSITASTEDSSVIVIVNYPTEAGKTIKKVIPLY